MNLFLKILNKYFFLKKKYEVNKIAGKLNINQKKSIVISGVPRGGTTWLAELLNTDKKSAILWEPLHPEYYPPVKQYNFKYRQFFDAKYSDNRIYTLFDNMLRGKLLSMGILQRTNINQLRNAEYFIIKFCRANRLLPWLTTNFEFKKTIHLLRHPCAVVASQMRFGAWDNVPANFTKEELKPDGFIEKYYDILSPINTIEEKLAAIWCLDNIIPLEENKNNNWISITYENLLLDPEQTFQLLGLDFNDDIKNKFYQPSTTTKKGSPIKSKEDVKQQLSYWKKTLNEKQVASIINILKQFNIAIYSKDIMPTVNY